MKRVKYWLTDILLCTLLAIVIGLFWNGFMRGSYFSWTVSQNQYWDAIIEMCGALAIYLTILMWDQCRIKAKGILCAIVFLGFTYLHSYFFASITGFLYIVFLYMTGYLLCVYPSKKIFHEKPDFHLCIVGGIAGIILIVALSSALRVGTPEHLRHFFPYLFLAEVVLMLTISKAHRKSHIASQERCEKNFSWLEAFWAAVLMTGITVCACRANMGTDYDSLWYGFRSQLVLAPETGIFDNPYLLSCVYTYSKGIECLALVFSGLPTLSYITALNIFFALLTTHSVYKFARIRFSRNVSMLIAACVAVTPSIMNMSTTAKSDNATVYLQIVALYYAAQALSKKSSHDVWKAFAVLILSYGFKPSSLIFSSLIIGLLLIAFIWKIKRLKVSECWVLSLGIVPVLILWYRTWLLSGVPVNSLITGVLQSIGFVAKPPYELHSNGAASLATILSADFLSERIRRLFSIFFVPTEESLSHIQIAWWGPLTTCCWLTAIISMIMHPKATIARFREDSVYCFHTVFFVLLSGLSIGSLLLLTRPDGNYFSLICIASYIQVLFEVNGWNRGIKAYCKTGTILLILCNFLLLTATSWSWGVGLTPINLEHRGYYNHQEEYVLPKLRSNGIETLYEYLDQGKARKIMGFVQDAETYFLLPVIGDTYYQQMKWAPNSLNSVDNLKEYMRYAEVDGIIVENALLKNDSMARDHLSMLANEGILQTELQTDNYSLFYINLDEKTVDQSAVDFILTLNN